MVNSIADVSESFDKDLDLLNSEETVEVPPSDKTADKVVLDKDKEITPLKEEDYEKEEVEQEEENEDNDEDKVKDEEEVEEDKSKDEDEKGSIDKVPQASVKEVKAKYPTIFKEFPELKTALFQARAFKEVFPSIEEAREASGKSDDFSFMEEKLLSGKPEDFGQFLSAINTASPKALESVAGNFLPTLYSINPNLYMEATAPLAQNIVKAMYKAGITHGNENLKASALHAAKYLFDDHEIATDKKSIPAKTSAKVENDPERVKFEQERTEFAQTKYNDFRGEVVGDAKDSIIRVIENGLDPSLTPYEKRNVINDIAAELTNVLQSDKDHQNMMNSLWGRHGKVDNKELKTRILSTHLARVRSLIPSIRAKIVGEVLKQSGRTSVKPTDEKKVDNKVREIRSAGNSGGGSKNKPVDLKNVDWRKTSDMDILSS